MSLKVARKLGDKKYRDETGLFLVEGKKSIHELLNSDFTIETIYTTENASGEFEEAVRAYKERIGTAPEIVMATEEKLAFSGTFRSNNAGIAVARQREAADSSLFLTQAQTGYVLVLDDVRDPGNLGTIIRTADWFCVTRIVASETTTDFYNPKTIAGSMGSFCRVDVVYTNLLSFLSEAKKMGIPSLVAVLNGTLLGEAHLPSHGLLVMGSESHGVRAELLEHVDTHVTIPRHGKAESLNVATATGILLSELKR